MNTRDSVRENFLEDNSIYYDTPNYEIFIEAFNLGYHTGKTDELNRTLDKEYEKGYENGFDAGARWAKEY